MISSNSCLHMQRSKYTALKAQYDLCTLSRHSFDSILVTSSLCVHRYTPSSPNFVRNILLRCMHAHTSSLNFFVCNLCRFVQSSRCSKLYQNFAFVQSSRCSRLYQNLALVQSSRCGKLYQNFARNSRHFVHSYSGSTVPGHSTACSENKQVLPFTSFQTDNS